MKRALVFAAILLVGMVVGFLGNAVMGIISASPMESPLSGRNITLDAIKPDGMNLYYIGNEEEPVLIVEVNYYILAGEEVIKHSTRDITELLPENYITQLTNFYNLVFQEIEEIELQ